MGGGLCAARGSANRSASFRTTRTPNPHVPSYGLTTSGPTFSSGVNRSGYETTYGAGMGTPAARRSRSEGPAEVIERPNQLRLVDLQVRQEGICPCFGEMVRIPRDDRQRTEHGPTVRKPLDVRVVARRPRLAHDGPVGGEVRTRRHAKRGRGDLGEINGGHGQAGIRPVERDELRTGWRRLDPQVLAVEIAMDQRRREPRAVAVEPTPVLVQVVELLEEAVEKRQVAIAERGIVQVVANGITRGAHLVAVATRSRVRQARSAGDRARLGVQESEPLRRRGPMIGPVYVVFLTLDLADEEPADVLVLNGAVEMA